MRSGPAPSRCLANIGHYEPRPPGTGKSHLATGIGVAAVRAGRSVYRCSLAELIEALTKAEREGRLA